MKKSFVVSILAGFLLQSLVVYSVKASDDEEDIIEVSGEKAVAVHEGYRGGSVVVRQRVDAWVENSTNTGGPSLDVGRLAGKLDKIGSDAKATLEDIEEVKADSKKLDDHLSVVPKPSSSVVVSHGFMGFGPDWAVGALFLPTDGTDQFNHRRWAINLSPSVNGGNARSNVEGYTAIDLADNLHIGAWNCAAGHIETSGHRYAGANACCQGYVRVVRQELLGLVAFASRHSRTHRTYVSEFERFERQVNLLDNQVRANAAAHGYAVPAPVAYTTQRPVDRYRHIHGPAQTFSDWLKWLSPNSNTSAEILSFTDVDDLGLMSQKVFVQGRNAACGHSAPGNSYTDYNWCCGHHYTRSMKIDMFQVALDLLVNQRNHDEYVRQAKVFEDFARRTISSYWTGWTGVPTSLIMTGGAGTVVSTSTGPVLTASEPSNAPYQDLKTDRERLMGGLKRAIATLKSAEECTEISKGVLEIGRHCGNMTGIGFGVASLQQDLEVATQNVKDLTAKNKILKKAIADRLESERADAIAEEKSRSAAREKELLERITKSDESVAKIQADFRDREEQNKKMVQKMIDDQTEATRAASKIKDEESRRITGMTSLSTTLGQILHELNMQRNPNDLYAFGTLTEDGITPFGPGRMDMVARAQILGKIQRAIMERKPSFSSAFGDPS